MRREHDAAGVFGEQLRAVRGERVQRVGIEDERTRIVGEKFGDVHIELLAHARPHADGDRVRSENVSVERLVFAQDRGGKFSDGMRVQFTRHTQLGIARARFQARARSQKRRAAVRPSRKDARRAVAALVRIGAARGEVCFYIGVLPHFGALLARGDPDVRNGDLARKIGAVRKEQRGLHLPHRHRLVRAHAGLARDPTLREPARQVAGDHVGAAAVDERNERRALPFDGTRKPRSEQTVHDDGVPTARNAREELPAVFFPDRRAVR